jgi:hypothetical protein
MGGDFEKVVQFAQRLEQFCDIRILCCFNQTLLENIICTTKIVHIAYYNKLGKNE